ncbi:hypothetical protein [Arthrobacter luteolus]|uniref:hypothetical protein n=1 Tax=Arthrobacter luteolus TaxID=98672 RepID=UPI00083385B1|nr:hypothetical protein [Arthrobacter luteolus]
MAFYPSIPASDGTSMTPPENAEFKVYELSDTTFSSPLPLQSTSGLNAAPLVTTGQGVLPPVNVVSPNFRHVFKSGEWEWERQSFDGAQEATEKAAEEAARSAAAAEKAASEVTKPADQAVDEGIKRADLPAKVATAVAAAPAVVAAAAAAVDANPKFNELKAATDRIDATAVFSGDPRLLEEVSSDEISFGIVDQEGRRLWLEAGLDGKPTPYAAGLAGGAVGVQEAILEDIGFAVVDSQDRIVFAPPLDYPTPDWAHWGDSITDDLVTGEDAWVRKLAAKTGRHHYNGGWYNQKHDQIAARQGGLPALVTVEGNATKPAGGTVISSISNSPVLYSKTRWVRGTLAGVPGMIQQTYTAVTLFYPDIPGINVIPPRSLFIPADGLNMRDRHITIWSGRNDVLEGDPDLVVGSIQSMIDYLNTSVKRVLVLEVLPSTSDGAAGKAKLDALNAALKTAFRPGWLPIASWLRTDDAATAAGIAFTNQDRADIAASLTPTSFRSDSTHLSAAGCAAVAYRVHLEAQKRGWL